MLCSLTCQRRKMGDPPPARPATLAAGGPTEQCCRECGIQRATPTSLCAGQFVAGLYAQDRAGIVAVEGVANAMRVSGFRGSAEGIRRKLRGVSAVVGDPGATQHEWPLQRPESAPAAAGEGCRNPRRRLDGQCVWARQMGKESNETGLSPVTKGDWTDDAFRLSRALRRGYRNLGL